VKADVEALLAPRVAEFRKVSHPALHPGRAAEVLVDGKAVGVIGELHPRWVQSYDLPSAPVLFELDFEAVLSAKLVKAQSVSKFQAARRDLALVVDEAASYGELLAALRAAAPAIVTEIGLFDVYRGKGVEEGKKSLAFRVLLQDAAKTLTDEDVEPAIAALLAAATAQGAVLRA